MTPAIIDTFRKDKLHEPGHGYGRNIGTIKNPEWVGTRGIPMSSEIVHTTNNPNKNTKPWNEATFLRDSPDVSCGDFIDKNGNVYIILPDDLLAWHSGAALAPFTNRHSFGTELHVSVGETPTQAQLDSLAYRIQQRRAKYGTTKERIDTHRAVALPKGRKSDPEGWPDAAFYAWRDSLFVPTEPDYAKLWGELAPFNPTWGIPQAYIASHKAGRPWGRVLTTEQPFDGGIVQRFEAAIATWDARTGTTVYMRRA